MIVSPIALPVTAVAYVPAGSPTIEMIWPTANVPEVGAVVSVSTPEDTVPAAPVTVTAPPAAAAISAPVVGFA